MTPGLDTLVGFGINEMHAACFGEDGIHTCAVQRMPCLVHDVVARRDRIELGKADWPQSLES